MSSPPSEAESPGANNPQQRVTLRGIAKAMGISHVTVSLALRNHPRISEPQKKRIREKAQELGYVPDPMLSALAHYRHSRIDKPVQAALAWPNTWPNPADLRNYHEFDHYWLGAARAAEKFGYHLEEFIVNEQMTPHRLEKVLLTRNIRGILMPPQRGICDWAAFKWNEFSVVRFGRGSGDIPQFHMVTSAQAANAALALEKIREKGYERIGFVLQNTKSWTYIGGILQAESIDSPEEQRLPAFLYESSESPDMEGFQSWLNRWKPDAILTDNRKIRRWLKETRYASRRKIGLAGLNILDMEVDAGIYQNPEEIGRVGVLVLVSLINDHDRGVPPIHREILVKGDWVDGASLPPKR